jgi:phosphate transport system protein
VSHLEESLQRDINRISTKIRRMAGLAEDALHRSMTALDGKDRQLAYSVILRDQRIDELEKEIDRLCLEFIVRQQPVAQPLRFAYVATKINAEIERVGDYAESIARQLLVLFTMDVSSPRERFTEIANKAIPMFHSAAEAFVTQNPDLARSAMESEEDVDRLRYALSTDLVTMSQTGALPTAALIPLLNIMNRLERVADQAKSICQEVLYMCTGEYLKHSGSDVFRVLFVDNDASVSRIAEAVGNALGQTGFIFSSAGLERAAPPPGMMAFLKEKGLDISEQDARGIDQIPHIDHYQVIVGLTKEARHTFPPPPTKAVCVEWNVFAPDNNAGSERTLASYEQTYGFLINHVRDLVEAVVEDKAVQRNDT